MVHDGYADQLASDVALQLKQAAQLFAHALSRLDDAGWGRSIIYNYPAPTERSLRWLAIHTWHEVTHHLRDVASQLDWMT